MIQLSATKSSNEIPGATIPSSFKATLPVGDPAYSDTVEFSLSIQTEKGNGLLIQVMPKNSAVIATRYFSWAKAKLSEALGEKWIILFGD